MVCDVILGALSANRLAPRRAMCRDESVYPNAHAFNPGRFLKDGHIDPDVKDPKELVLGFGRRYVHPHQTPAFNPLILCAKLLGFVLEGTSLYESCS